MSRGDERDPRVLAARRAELGRKLSVAKAAADEAGTASVGRELVAGWCVEDVLGRGGFSTVYKVLHRTHGQRRAMKVLLDDADDPELRRRFLQEAESLTALSHPHVVGVHEHGVLSDGRRYVLLDLLTGETLRERLSLRGELSIARTVEVVAAVGGALQCLHDAGIIHRDVKPSNVILEADTERPVLIDLGVCKSIGALTRTQERIGTLPYMSPSILRHGSRAAVPADDVHALGVLAYELLAGRRPWSGSSIGALLERMTHPPAPLRQLRDDLPVEASSLVQSVLVGEWELGARELGTRLRLAAQPPP